MKQATTRDHRLWVNWYHANGSSAAATCRHFNINRSTFYRWLKRYDAAQPQKPLKALSRKPRTKRQPTWTDLDLRILSEINMNHPTLGAKRLTAILNRYEIGFSMSTVGRMLAKIKRRCPVCRGKQGHVGVLHIWQQDLLRFRQRRDEAQALLDATMRLNPQG